MRKGMTINLLRNNSCSNCAHSTTVKRNIEITSVDVMSDGQISVGSVGDLVTACKRAAEGKDDHLVRFNSETECLKYGVKTVDKDHLCHYWKEHGQERRSKSITKR